MVSWWTRILKFKLIFILARNYNVFVVDMDSVKPSDRSQIGLESSESKKCSQRFEMDHFC